MAAQQQAQIHMRLFQFQQTKTTTTTTPTTVAAKKAARDCVFRCQFTQIMLHIPFHLLAFFNLF